MKVTTLAATVLFAVACSSQVQGQPPPPLPDQQAPMGVVSTVNGTISQFNYGPEGRVEGFLISPGTMVFLPPDWAMQVETIAKRGDPVKVTGYSAPLPSGMQVIDAQTLTVAGKNLSLLQPTQPSPYAGSGVIRQLNYDRDGTVNGFVLDNGMIARTPPFGTSDVSAIKAGAQIALSGFARTAATGRTVVDVQSITVNGQTISMNAGPFDAPPAPPPGPPGRGGRGGRRGRGDPPLPPPPGR